MSLVYAAICPHPPIIIPEIGGDNLSQVQQTINAMEKVAENFNLSDVDTSIFISPHTYLSSFAMTVCTPKVYTGDFADFGHSDLVITSPSDINMASKIISESQKANLPIISQNDGILDHGVMVPLYYIQKFTDYTFGLVEIGYSNLSVNDHIKFGKAIGSVIKKSNKRVALIISGDLSHRHLDNYYKQFGNEFDQKIVDLVTSNKLTNIANLDLELVELAGECGFRSLLIALGVLTDLNVSFNFLSYEKPFGVGYLVAESAKID